MAALTVLSLSSFHFGVSVKDFQKILSGISQTAL